MENENLQNQNLPNGENDSTQGTATVPQTNELMIPKRRFDEVTQMYRDALSKSSALEKEIEGYKTKDVRIAELEKQINDMKESYEKEKAIAKKTIAIDKMIGDTSVDSEVLKKLLDIDKITINDKGEIEGLEEQIKRLQKEKSYLFKKSQPVVTKSVTQTTKPEKTLAQKLAEKKVNAMRVTTKSKNYFNV